MARGSQSKIKLSHVLLALAATCVALYIVSHGLIISSTNQLHDMHLGGASVTKEQVQEIVQTQVALMKESVLVEAKKAVKQEMAEKAAADEKKKAQVSHINAKKFVGFEWNQGDVNNELITMNTILRFSKVWKRVVFMPEPWYFKQWIGLLDEGENYSPWDLTELRKEFDILTETEVVKAMGSLENHPVLGPRQKLQPRGIRTSVEGWDPTEKGYKCDLKWHPQWWEKIKEMFGSCDYVHIRSDGGWLEGNALKHGGVSPFLAYPKLHFAPWIKAEADRWLKTKHFKKPLIGVHLRTRIEEGETMEAKIKRGFQVCSDMINTRINRWDPPIEDEEERNLLRSHCHNNPDKLLKIVDFYKVEGFELGHGVKGEGAFLLSSDNQYPALDQKFRDVGAVEYSQHDYDVWLQQPHMQERKKNWLSKYIVNGRPKIPGVFETRLHLVWRMVIDMYLMTRVDFFIGQPESTVSFSVCLMRGEERLMKSSVCRHFYKCFDVCQ
mmetsp:Transcript_21205/g.42097  ORF Transcript_21205/g.42097 Transcript_21205/m.42097 type:complete len:496 (-) Transcript_21205:295-1782(-)